MKKSQIFGIFAIITLGIIPVTLKAQLNNKPFSFKGTPNGSVGMSIGGQQAIINKEITGISAENLIRSTGGILLNVTEGPGKSAIVSFQGGEFIPAFKGTSWKGSNQRLSANNFNDFFTSEKNGSNYIPAQLLNSTATISTWTTRVATDGYPASYSPGSSVDEWTGMTY